MFAKNADVDNALGPALQAAFQLASNRGGKVVVVSSCAPTVGAGALKVRNGQKSIGSSKESKYLVPGRLP